MNMDEKKIPEFPSHVHFQFSSQEQLTDEEMERMASRRMDLLPDLPSCSVCGVLTALFDWQRFTQNPRLVRLITETEGRYGGVPLSEDDLDEVWAAGGLFPPPEKEQTCDGP